MAKYLLHRETANSNGPAGTNRSNEEQGMGVVVLNPDTIIAAIEAAFAGETEVKSTAVTVGIVPTALPLAPLTDRKKLYIFNTSYQTLYIGGATVSASNGLPVGSGLFNPEFSIAGATIYGVYPSAPSGEVRILEVA